MKNKLLVILAMVSTLSLTAQTETQTETVNATVSVGYESEYMFRGAELADDIVLGSIELSYGPGYLGTAMFWDVESNAAFDGEVDFYGGVLLADLLEVDDYGLSVDVGATVYTYPNAQKSLAETEYTVEPYVGFIIDNMLLNPSAYVYYDVVLESYTVEGRVSETYVSGQELPLLGAMSLTPSVAVGYTDIHDVTPNGANAEDAYTYVSAALDASFDVKGATVSVGPRYNWTQDAVIDFNELTWGASVGYAF